MNLKDMSVNELHKLKAEIQEEIKRRSESNLVLYTHNCKGSAKYHINKYKHWAKIVQAVDTTKTNGYAFIGPFLEVDREHKIPEGSIVVEVCDNEITAYRILAEEKEFLDSAKTNSMNSLIENLAAVI